MGSQTSENAIPTVDISTLLSPTASETDRRRVIEDVRQASTTYGFFNLVGHGIPPALFQQAFESSRLFFALPEEKRMKVHVGKALGKSFRGWEPPLIQQHNQGLLPDTKEVLKHDKCFLFLFLSFPFVLSIRPWLT